MLDEPCATGEQTETNTAWLVPTMTTMDAETQTKEQSERSTASKLSKVMDAETQTEEFDYLLDATRSAYKASDKDIFDSDEKVQFYTGLPVALTCCFAFLQALHCQVVLELFGLQDEILDILGYYV